MWRDRTNLYISYRQSYAHHPASKSRYANSSNGYSDHPEERRGLIASELENHGDAVIEMDILPPRWLDVQDEVTDLLQTVVSQIAKLEPLHGKHVLPGFEDEAVKKKEEREIEHLTQDITRGFQSCQKAIRRIDAMIKESNQQGGLSKAETVMAKNLQVSLASRVGEVSASFRKKQSSYLKKLRKLSGMASPLDRSTSPNHGTAYADHSIVESDADRSLSQATLQQTAKKRQTGNETLIEYREKAIEDIAQGIIELANIFQELQTMVIDQGTMLDRIDYNIERMAEDVKGADKELRVATGYQKRSTKRKVILLLILIVVGLFILLMVKPKRKQSRDNPTSSLPGGAPQDDQIVTNVLRARGEALSTNTGSTFNRGFSAEFQTIGALAQKSAKLVETNVLAIYCLVDQATALTFAKG